MAVPHRHHVVPGLGRRPGPGVQAMQRGPRTGGLPLTLPRLAPIPPSPRPINCFRTMSSLIDEMTDQNDETAPSKARPGICMYGTRTQQEMGGGDTVQTIHRCTYKRYSKSKRLFWLGIIQNMITKRKRATL